MKERRHSNGARQIMDTQSIGFDKEFYFNPGLPENIQVAQIPEETQSSDNLIIY